MKRLISSLIALAAGLVLASSAQAATAGSTLTVSANMVAACSVATTAVNFGDVLGNGEQSAGDVTVNCAQGINYVIALDAGLYYDAGTRVRRMYGPSAFLSYRLYSFDYTVEWGDACNANTYPDGPCFGSTGSGAPQTRSVNGKIVSGPGPVGAYSDTVVVTVNY